MLSEADGALLGRRQGAGEGGNRGQRLALRHGTRWERALLRNGVHGGRRRIVVVVDAEVAVVVVECFALRRGRQESGCRGGRAWAGVECGAEGAREANGPMASKGAGAGREESSGREAQAALQDACRDQRWEGEGRGE